MQNKATKFHPILFSTPMVQAILEGRKTQTRRMKGLEGVNKSPSSFRYDGFNEEDSTHCVELLNENKEPTERYKEIECPYEVGDVLWVREKFAPKEIHDEPPGDRAHYFASDSFASKKWKPSIFMPKEACRTFLKIKSIRVERLQDISEEDAQAEGAHFLYHGLGTVIIDSHPDWDKLYKSHASYKDGFHYIWKYINGEDSWQFNPFVFVYEFEKIEKPLDFI